MTQTGRRRTPTSGGNTKGRKEGFGSIRVLPSGRVQARYTGPDGLTHHAPTTFQTKMDARGWLALRHAEIISGKWKPRTSDATMTFRAYATTWLADRPLKPRTRNHYRQLLEQRLLPRFGALRPAQITPDMVRAWHADMGEDTPTLRAHCYSLLRSILATAVHDELISANPCHIKGAGNSKRVHKITTLTWPSCRTCDNHARAAAADDLARRLVRSTVRRTDRAAPKRHRPHERRHPRPPRSHESRRPVRRRHPEVRRRDTRCRDTAAPDPDASATPVEQHHRRPRGLLFPAAGDPTRHLAPASLYRVFYPARQAASRPDLRWHDLRHYGAVLAASTGATLAELMARLGHSTPQAAMRYQHASRGRDMEIARRLSAMANNPLT